MLSFMVLCQVMTTNRRKELDDLGHSHNMEHYLKFWIDFRQGGNYLLPLTEMVNEISRVTHFWPID